LIAKALIANYINTPNNALQGQKQRYRKNKTHKNSKSFSILPKARRQSVFGNQSYSDPENSAGGHYSFVFE
jgi:hypothetical protein